MTAPTDGVEVTYVRSLVPETIGSLVDERLARDGARQALVFEDRRWTFAELARNIDAVARGLVALGVAPGEKVSLWMMNRPEWIEQLWQLCASARCWCR